MTTLNHQWFNLPIPFGTMIYDTKAIVYSPKNTKPSILLTNRLHMNPLHKGTTELLFAIDEWLPSQESNMTIKKIYKYLKLSDKNKKITVENNVDSEDNRWLMLNLVKK